MMKLIYRIVCLSLCIMQISCIKDEAPNAEADIIACTVPADILRRSPVIENNRVTVSTGGNRLDSIGSGV